MPSNQLKNPNESQQLERFIEPGIRKGETPSFYKLSEYVFEELCRDLLFCEPLVSTCDIYGDRGQTQYGIDIIARRENDEIEVGQCKCYEDFPPQKIRQASKDFFDHWDHWSTQKVKRFILFVASDLKSTQRQNEISKQKKYFLNYGIEYEAWPAPQIRNKLRPHRGIVASYMEPSDYWIQEICGISPTSLFENNTQTQTSDIVLATFENQITLLAEKLSGDTKERLQNMRKAWKEGKQADVNQWFKDIKKDKWPFLSPNVKADILLFEAGIALDKNGDFNQARKLTDEAKSLRPTQDQTRIQAMITYFEQGPEEAITLLSQRDDDINCLNLRAGILLELGRIEESLEVLNFEDRSNAEA